MRAYATTDFGPKKVVVPRFLSSRAPSPHFDAVAAKHPSCCPRPHHLLTFSSLPFTPPASIFTQTSCSHSEYLPRHDRPARHASEPAATVTPPSAPLRRPDHEQYQRSAQPRACPRAETPVAPFNLARQDPHDHLRSRRRAHHPRDIRERPAIRAGAASLSRAPVTDLVQACAQALEQLRILYCPRRAFTRHRPAPGAFTGAGTVPPWLQVARGAAAAISSDHVVTRRSAGTYPVTNGGPS